MFEYFDGYENKVNADGIWEYVPLSADLLKYKFETAEHFLIEIGFTKDTLRRYFSNYFGYECYGLTNLKDYLLYATPAAIIQMNKRLKKIKKSKI